MRCRVVFGWERNTSSSSFGFEFGLTSVQNLGLDLELGLVAGLGFGFLSCRADIEIAQSSALAPISGILVSRLVVDVRG